jgi:hypothetical protein
VKRLCLLGMAVAGLLTAGVSTAATAKVKPAKPKSVTTKLSCKLTVVTQPPANDISITPGINGAQFGKVSCPGPIGGGVVSDTYTTATSGNVTAKYTTWFKGGTLGGQFKLIPTGGGQPSAGNNTFGAQSYTGSATVTGGSGSWKTATGKATLTCSTADGVHLSCTESLKVTTTAAS